MGLFCLYMDEPITLIGQTNHRNQYNTFGIKQSDRMHHCYLLGKTGVGKSTLIKNLILQDIHAGRGCALLDPHGDLVSEVVAQIPNNRKDRLIYLNVPDPNLDWGYMSLNGRMHGLFTKFNNIDIRTVN